MAIKLIKCGLQPQEKLEKMLIVLIGGFLIYILKHECHMDDGTVKAIIEFYNYWFGATYINSKSGLTSMF